jgi:two-component system, sensor histidine kinase YesM
MDTESRKATKLFGIFINRGLFKSNNHKMSLKVRLIFSFLFAAIIPLILVQFIFYLNTTLSMQNKVDDLLKINLLQTAKNVNMTIESYNDLLFQIFSDNEIVQLTKKMDKGSDDEQISAFGTLREKLGTLANSKEGISGISILCPNGLVVSYDKVTGLATQHFWIKYNDITKTDFYMEAEKTDQTVLIPTSFADQYGDKGLYLFHMAKRMFDIERLDKTTLGVIVISLKEQLLSDACNGVYGTIENGKQKNGFNFIVDQNQKVISFPEKAYIGEHEEEILTGNSMNFTRDMGMLNGWIKDLSQKPVLMNKYEDRNLGWTFINITDKDRMFSEVYSLQRLFTLIGLAAVLFSIILVIYFSGRFSKSVRKIVQAMTTAKSGELNVHVDLNTKDEISIIATTFNSMMVQIKKLIEDVKCAARHQKDAEIKALEAQINPHFLYNTLDTINWVAIENDQYKISNMLKNLAQILRYSINQSNEIVTFKQEIEWLRQYIYLQQIRFDYSFHCEVEIDENVLDCKIHKLLIQPLIENAIIHGFDGYTSGGLISVSVKIFEVNNLVISIKDNGRGIDESKLADLLKEDGNETIITGRGFGVKNVFNRLKLYYGEDCKWNITSEPGKGTEIVIKIPRQSG